MPIQRREFLSIGSKVALLSLAGCASRNSGFLRDDDQAASVERRVGAVVQAYDSQGDHRTATEGDVAAANWLADETRKAGAEAALEFFDLSRVDPRTCYLNSQSRRIEGV